MKDEIYIKSNEKCYCNLSIVSIIYAIVHCMKSALFLLKFRFRYY